MKKYILAFIVLILIIGAGIYLYNKYYHLPISGEKQPEYQLGAVDFYNKGLSLYNERKNTEAVEAFRKAIEIEPNYKESYYEIGRGYFIQGNSDEAIKQYEQVLEIDSEDSAAKLVLSYAYEKAGRYEDAEDLLFDLGIGYNSNVRERLDKLMFGEQKKKCRLINSFPEYEEFDIEKAKRMIESFLYGYMDYLNLEHDIKDINIGYNNMNVILGDPFSSEAKEFKVYEACVTLQDDFETVVSFTPNIINEWSEEKKVPIQGIGAKEATNGFFYLSGECISSDHECSAWAREWTGGISLHCDNVLDVETGYKDVTDLFSCRCERQECLLNFSTDLAKSEDNKIAIVVDASNDIPGVLFKNEKGTCELIKDIRKGLNVINTECLYEEMKNCISIYYDNIEIIDKIDCVRPR